MKKNKKKRKKRRRLAFVLELLVLLILAVGLAGLAYLSRIDHEGLSNLLINSGVSTSGYRNIAIFGIDSREGQQESGTRTDTIMVASINNRSKDIKLISVYRDTYLDNTDGVYRKATEAYEAGGASLAVNMLNTNLDLDIEDYVTVDFEAVIQIVDKLGGVDIDLTDEEVYWLNGYLVETSEVTGESYTEVSGPGMQTLTGIQALAYCRIRYTDGWDYRRTERQRDVLMQIFQKAQSEGIATLVSVINDMMPYISTSLGVTEIVSLASSMSRYSIVDSQGFPFESVAMDVGSADCVVPDTLSSNVSELHSVLFGVSDYVPSQTVQDISYQIVSVTGVS